jgi:hypothetical protein
MYRISCPYSVTLEDLDAEMEISSVWKMIGENINISSKENLGCYELRKHKPWFNEGCSELLDERKQAKVQWLQDRSEMNGDNLYNGRRETSRYLRREYLKDRIKELAANSKNKDIRDLYVGINAFKHSYQPRNDLVKD